jgi:hypothetical protein
MSFMDTGVKNPYDDERATVGPVRACLTASLALFGCSTTTQVYYSWGTALYLATTLVSAKTDLIRSAVHHERETSRGEEYWQTKVVEPCKELVVALAVLNGNFSRGMILQVSYFLLLVTGFSCMLLSKFFDNLWSRMHADLGGFDVDKAHLDVHPILPYGFTFMAVGAMALTSCMTFMPVWLLGAVSTACDDVTEDLNELRLERFTNEVDERVSMLERAFRGINHGQEIGFKVMGLVLTKKVLGIIVFEFLCGLLFVVPIIWSNTAMSRVEDHSGSLDWTSCALSHPQKTAIQSTVEAFNLTHCVRTYWSNVTVSVFFG